MKKNKEKRLPQQQLVKGANEALLEGASQMSGVAVKDLAAGMVSGALMAKAKASQKLRRKAQRKAFKNKFKKSSVTVDPKEIKKEVLPEKIGNITVGRPVQVKQPKKDSLFKMKGFSGFGNKK
jgi:hypothetical protein